MVGREGVAAAALTLRWGSYLAVLLDHDKPVWPEVHAETASRIGGVGELLPLVSSGDAWQLGTLVFVAPPDAATLPVLVLAPVATDAGPSYPGMDFVTLDESIPAGAGGPPTLLNIIAYPNPTAGHVTFRLGAPRKDPLAVSIIDVRGSIIRRLGAARLDAKTRVWTWDGNDGRGNPVPSGLYFYKLTTPQGKEAQKLTLNRH